VAFERVGAKGKQGVPRVPLYLTLKSVRSCACLCVMIVVFKACDARFMLARLRKLCHNFRVRSYFITFSPVCADFLRLYCLSLCVADMSNCGVVAWLRDCVVVWLCGCVCVCVFVWLCVCMPEQGLGSPYPPAHSLPIHCLDFCAQWLPSCLPSSTIPPSLSFGHVNRQTSTESPNHTLTVCAPPPDITSPNTPSSVSRHHHHLHVLSSDLSDCGSRNEGRVDLRLQNTD